MSVDNLSKIMDKLNREIADVKGDFAADVMKQSVKDTLIQFSSQNEEFGEAILNSTKSFKECMAAVAKDFKQGISDYEAYKRAVKFYFPAAEISFQMQLRTNQSDKILSFKLTELMGDN